MAIKLYDVVPSSNCDRVKIVLYEKGLSYEIVRLDEKKMDQKKPEHLKLTPMARCQLSTMTVEFFSSRALLTNTSTSNIPIRR